MPSTFSAATRSTITRAACANGSIVRICEPMWTCTPATWSPGRAAASRRMATALATGMPNLLCSRPVEMWGCVPASTSGLTRRATRARVPWLRAMASIRSSSPGDSALITPTPRPMARSSSSRDLPTPVNTSSSGMNPARSATSISPTEFASAFTPSARRWRMTARVELAFSA